MAYEAYVGEAGGRTADDGRQILNGAKPAHIPIYRPTKSEFVINLKVTRAASLILPCALLATADEVIERGNAIERLGSRNAAPPAGLHDGSAGRDDRTPGFRRLRGGCRKVLGGFFGPPPSPDQIGPALRQLPYSSASARRANIR